MFAGVRILRFGFNGIGKMKKTISFDSYSVMLERSKTAATIKITPVVPIEWMALADNIDQDNRITVTAVLVDAAKIAFIVDCSMTNNELLDTICDAITASFDTDTTISNERNEEFI